MIKWNADGSRFSLQHLALPMTLPFNSVRVTRKSLLSIHSVNKLQILLSYANYMVLINGDSKYSVALLLGLVVGTKLPHRLPVHLEMCLSTLLRLVILLHLYTRSDVLPNNYMVTSLMKIKQNLMMLY